MALTNEFLDAVKDGKKTRVRIMIKDIMLVDTSLSAYDEMITYAEEHMTDLYDLHDGEELKTLPNDWTEDYMNQQMASVVTNFSRERVRLLKCIVKYRYADKIKGTIQTKHVTVESNCNTNSSKTNNGPTGMQIAGGVIVAVGVVALVGGIASSNVPVTIAGGVALAGGAVVVAAGANRESK